MHSIRVFVSGTDNIALAQNCIASSLFSLY